MAKRERAAEAVNNDDGEFVLKIGRGIREKSKPVVAMLTPTQHAFLSALAEEKETSVSNIVRQAIKHCCAKMGSPMPNN